MDNQQRTVSKKSCYSTSSTRQIRSVWICIFLGLMGLDGPSYLPTTDTGWLLELQGRQLPCPSPTSFHAIAVVATSVLLYSIRYSNPKKTNKNKATCNIFVRPASATKDFGPFFCFYWIRLAVYDYFITKVIDHFLSGNFSLTTIDAKHAWNLALSHSRSGIGGRSCCSRRQPFLIECSGVDG